MPQRRTVIVWAVATFAITVAFGRLAGHNLANYRPWSNDEGELMAVAYKLATQGVLGSDMAVGFFGADHHYLETLPLQPVLDALAFRLLGPGILQARLISLLAAIALIWSVGWLALRWYGLLTAVVGELLLVGWRSNLTAASNGLPLLGVARTARYDVLAVAAAWVCLTALDAALRRPVRARAFTVGVFAGIASLSQFFGLFVLPLVGLTWIISRMRKQGAWLLAGAAVVLLPFVAFGVLNAADARGQLGAYGDRGAIWQPGFLATNVMSEPDRYAQLATWPPALDISGAGLLDNPISPWLVVVAIGPSLTLLLWRSRKPESMGDRLLLLSLLVFGGLLALLDRTKTQLYTILLLPSVCLCVAAASVHLARWASRWAGLAVGLGSVLVIGVILLEGVHAYAVDWVQAGQVTPYLPLGQQIDAALEPDTTLLGPERWWWALHDHPYVSLRYIWFQWAALDSAAADPPRFAELVKRTHATNVVVNINVRADLQAFPETLQQQFWTFIDQCTTRTLDLENPNYFETEVYRITDDCQ